MSLLLNDIVETSRKVAAVSGRLEKIGLLADLLRRTPSHVAPTVVSYLTGELPQRRTGIGYATVRAAWPDGAAEAPALAVEDADATFAAINAVSGKGSTGERHRLLHGLLARATRAEQEFIARLIGGELRQGALEGVMVDAVARAADVPAAAVRRAVMFAGSLPEVAGTALDGGSAALAGLGLRLFQPLQPMLAGTADHVDDAVSRLGAAAFEFKLDGARIQVHKSGDDVRVFTRRLNEVTAAVPEIVETVRVFPARELVLDGEALALRADGGPLPFQETMRRFGSRLDVDRLRVELPLSSFFFDCLHADGETLIDRSTADRFDALEEIIPHPSRIPRTITGDAAEAAAFLDAARRAGHEGLIAKALDAPYEAGRRGKNWIKVKPANTLDLVVLAAEWGHGRRRGWLSNLHLGARDPENGGFVMLGKTFKGMTDELLAWQTHALQEIAIGHDDLTVYVRPELVIEVSFNEVQTSPRYPAGLALRFARVKGYRPDKRPADADTIDAVRAIFDNQMRADRSELISTDTN
ncbi:MAG: ATP-dependent DNA ligase [Longimicrobiales bacterium]